MANGNISHSVIANEFNDSLVFCQQRIKDAGDKPHVTVERQLDFLEQLSNFELGRYLIQHGGLNGYWIDYVVTYPEHRERLEGTISALEDALCTLPVSLATQERHRYFLKLNQACVKEGVTLACIPSGIMGELLYLDYQGINDIHLCGIDYDEHTFLGAKNLAKEKGIERFCEFKQSDAWALSDENVFDLISSNGLNVYEADMKKNAKLYSGFYHALKPGGRLVTSFLTYPPFATDECEWEMDKINQEALLLQRIVFKDVLDVKFNCFTSSKEMGDMLNQIGFKEVTFHYDKAHIMPTVTAIR